MIYKQYSKKNYNNNHISYIYIYIYIVANEDRLCSVFDVIFFYNFIILIQNQT